MSCVHVVSIEGDVSSRQLCLLRSCQPFQLVLGQKGARYAFPNSGRKDMQMKQSVMVIPGLPGCFPSGRQRGLAGPPAFTPGLMAVATGLLPSPGGDGHPSACCLGPLSRLSTFIRVLCRFFFTAQWVILNSCCMLGLQKRRCYHVKAKHS